MKIILLGFRYTGKSTIGKAIADINNLHFVDLDDEIERISGKKIDKIVSKKDGWNEFRLFEIHAFNKAIKNDNVVISCGGGFGVNNQFCNIQNKTFGDIERDLLDSIDAVKILLDIDEKSLIKRIKNSYRRPNFVKGVNIIEENLRLFYERKTAYNSIKYDVKIDTSYDNLAFAIKKGKLYTVIGLPVWHSLSPVIHNNFISNIGKDNEYVYTKMEVRETSFDKIYNILTILNIKGVSITSPYKQKIMAFLSKIDDESNKIGAVNTIVFDKKNKTFNGYNTDWYGVVKALQMNIGYFSNKRIAIFGSGGGAKAAVIGCLKYTKNIVLFNRTLQKNEVFAKQFNLDSKQIDEFNGNDFDIIINATTVGLNENKSIIAKTKIAKHNVCFDMIYSPVETTFLKNALKKGCKIIYGTEMLVNQARMQFEKFLGKKVCDNLCATTLRNIQPKYYKKCIVVSGNDIKMFIKNLKTASKYSDFVELRVDYIKNVSKYDIEKIADEIKKIRHNRIVSVNNLKRFDAIFTNRHIKYGGLFNGTIIQCKDIIKYAISLGIFNFIDIDVSCIKSYNNILKNMPADCRTIISYHNFNNCLTTKKTIHLINKMLSFDGLPKVAMKIKTKSDIKVMQDVLNKYKTDNIDIIFAPMGSKKTRVFAWKYGSWTNFVCLNDKIKTANGQLSINDIEELELN